MKRIIFILVCLIAFGTVKAQDEPARKGRIFYIVQQPPTFHGDLSKYVAEHLNYPEPAIKRNIEGVVYVSFIVEKNGELGDVTLLKGTDPYLDNEALRLVIAMPKWTSGRQLGRLVRVGYVLPIKFSLNSKDTYDNVDEDSTETYVPDTKPMFKGDLNKYFQALIQYPQSAIDNNVEGTVSVSFVVSTKGKIQNAEVVNSVDSALDNEALSVVNSMPNWTVGLLQNKPVNVQVTIPVAYILKTKSVYIPATFNQASPADSKQK